MSSDETVVKRSRWLLPSFAALALLVALGSGWGFTVDDALISTRVAHHIRQGLGPRFNPGGPWVDCVTPLGWAWLLAPFSADGAWAGLCAARWLGVGCAFASVWIATRFIDRSLRARSQDAERKPVPLRALLGCVPLATCLPLGAWSSSGMETAFVMLIASLTLCGGWWTPGASALACALRPEMFPWALTLALSRPVSGAKARILGVAMTIAGPTLVALLRLSLFGHPAPLALLAKPSEASQGFVYAAFGFVQCGLPCLMFGTSIFQRAAVNEHGKQLRAQALALIAHLGALVIAGGDWMALYRLFVPVLPCAWAAGVVILTEQSKRVAYAKLLAASVAGLWLNWTLGSSSRGVFQARKQLVEAARGQLASARVVGALDVGWVGASGDFEVVDFAGLTDREIALLAGGHTSKRLPRELLWRKHVDTLVLLTAPGELPAADSTAWQGLRFARVVEARASALEGASEFAWLTTLPLAHTAQHYIIAQRPTERFALGGVDTLTHFAIRPQRTTRKLHRSNREIGALASVVCDRSLSDEPRHFRRCAPEPR
jgi:hypothetical protein